MILFLPDEQRIDDPKTRLLLVDDDPFILEMLQTSIGDLGYDFDTAVDGFEAMEKLRQGTFTLVLTDMTMPRLDGMGLLKQVKTDFPQLPVIIITGYTDTYTYTEVIRAGASDFIAKPFSVDELEAKISRVLREQSLINRLEHLSMRDALTGLFNRRGFEFKLQQEVVRADRQNYSLFMVMLDIDHFKDYNDTLGHPAGDKVLQKLGRILHQCIRENVDSSFRLGGDEFAVIIPYATLAQASQIAERIRELYENESRGDQTSISLGLSRFIRNSDHSIQEDLADCIERADRALYAGKEKGGNRVTTDQQSLS